MIWKRVRFSRTFLAVGIALAAAIAPQAPGGAVDAHRLLSVSGHAEIEGRPAFVHILVELPPRSDPMDVGRRSLARLGAQLVKPSPPSIEFTLAGPRWPQFFDRDHTNDFVPQLYNPGDDPTSGSETPLVNSHATWTNVESSSYAMTFAGTTTSGPGFDRVNVVTWDRRWEGDPGLLAVTTLFYEVATGFILDADVVINPAWRWSANATPAAGEVDVESVLLHENGHVAGLDHSLAPEAVMFPVLDSGVTKRTLAQDDIDGISMLYPLHPTPGHPLGERPVATRQGPPPRAGVVAELEETAPETDGLIFYLEFEPYAITDRGQVAFASELEACCGEGIFRYGGTPQLMAASGHQAPGGGRLGLGVNYGIGLNEAGDAAFTWLLDPFERPFGRNGGVYRWTSLERALRAVVVPNVTRNPRGNVFVGAGDQTTINDGGTVAFAGMYETSEGIEPPFGLGVFTAAADGVLSPVALPGDPAPSGGRFDYAAMPSLNERGDVAFAAHVAGDPCGRPSQRSAIGCDAGIFVRQATGDLTSIVRQGDSAPGGGTFRSARRPVINNRGDVLFLADLEQPGLRRFGVYLYRDGAIIPIARPGDAMPGGGEFERSSFTWALNDLGEVAFGAWLTTDTLGFGIDNGVFIWSGGRVRVVARTGDVLPGAGLMDLQHFPSIALNNRGQVLFSAGFFDDKGGNVKLVIVNTR